VLFIELARVKPTVCKPLTVLADAYYAAAKFARSLLDQGHHLVTRVCEQQVLKPEFPAKQNGMKKTPQAQLSDSKPQPARITRMLRQIQGSVQGARGKSPLCPEIAEWTGVPEGTVRDWFNDGGQSTSSTKSERSRPPINCLHAPVPAQFERT
jgi:hypothetical protein